MSMLERFKPAYLLLAGGFHRDCRARCHGGPEDPGCHPRIPAEMRHVEQLTVSDDCYTLTNTINPPPPGAHAESDFLSVPGACFRSGRDGAKLPYSWPRLKQRLIRTNVAARQEPGPPRATHRRGRLCHREASPLETARTSLGSAGVSPCQRTRASGHVGPPIGDAP